MFTLTATRDRDGKNSKVSASHRQILIDHLEAAASRNGLVIDQLGDGGHIYLRGEAVGTWEVSAS
ncbi:hypothetical protein SEA_KERBEROS_93 [Mycobacterium phage Kerberos]|uniref:hypothetical protein n=1 Tax=Mycobacterium phage Chy5 TaxID=1327948 RepID=UPI00032B6317|nr:hypothetical protein M178_gp85 [Mycobacterium phage Chy5]AGK86120.1 hypothetical protein Chy5_0085 [Mycobacterium phage Chy5]APC43141.1 hypothetical protein SEA_KERBEROS_93 [Mycobacterium phage Kerberos]APC46209.1 hypothetical protein PBI_STARSTUFF_93 [Mycobacterium phage StarStuff]